MGKLTGSARLLLVLLLELVPAQVQMLVLTQGNSSGVEAPSLIPEDGQIKVAFLEVLAKSSCQPMDQLVGLEQEFPWEVEYLYRPSSVLVRRCSGCCGDERCECHPTIERNITLHVMRILPVQSKVGLVFTEHQACECRPKLEPQLEQRPQRRKCKKIASRCAKCQLPSEQIFTDFT